MLLLAPIIAAGAIRPGRHTPLEDHRRRNRLLGSSFGIPGDNLTYDYIIVGTVNAVRETFLETPSTGTVKELGES